MDKGKAEPGIKRAIFSWAVGAGTARGEAALRGTSAGVLRSLQASLADRLVFAKIRDGLGGRIRYLVSGSAPLPASIAEFFHGHRPADHRGLRPDRNLADPDRQSARCAARRHGRPAAAGRRAADRRRRRDPGARPERHVGLLQQAGRRPPRRSRTAGSTPATSARSTSEGYLRITDRKKDLLVTSGGKKIAPQPIEAVLKRSPLVAEAVLLGDRRKFAAALIVPSFPALERRLKDLGRPPGIARRAGHARRRPRALPGDRRRAQPRALAVRAHQEDRAPARPSSRSSPASSRRR